MCLFTKFFCLFDFTLFTLKSFLSKFFIPLTHSFTRFVIILFNFILKFFSLTLKTNPLGLQVNKTLINCIKVISQVFIRKVKLLIWVFSFVK